MNGHLAPLKGRPIESLPLAHKSWLVQPMNVEGVTMLYGFRSADDWLATCLPRAQPFPDMADQLIAEALVAERSVAPSPILFDEDAAEWFHGRLSLPSVGASPWPFVATRRCPVLMWADEDSVRLVVRYSGPWQLDPAAQYVLPMHSGRAIVQCANEVQEHARAVAAAIPRWMRRLDEQHLIDGAQTDLLDARYASSRTHCLWRALTRSTVDSQCAEASSDLACCARLLDPFLD